VRLLLEGSIDLDPAANERLVEPVLLRVVQVNGQVID